jgi:hypothetical protein
MKVTAYNPDTAIGDLSGKIIFITGGEQSRSNHR